MFTMPHAGLHNGGCLFIAPWIYPQMTVIPPELSWRSLDSVRPWSICGNPHPTALHYTTLDVLMTLVGYVYDVW